MAQPVRQQAIIWGVTGVVFLLALWLLGSVLLPFVVGGAIAYLLDPLADRLERLGLSRTLATVVITAVGVVIFLVAAGILLPLIFGQAVALFDAAPGYIDQLQSFLAHRFPALMDSHSVLRKSLSSLGGVLQARGGAFLNGILSSAMSVINALVFIVVVPVVAFYLLLDWDHMMAELDKLLPRDHAPVIRRLGAEIDRTLASFVRGQLTVCAILGSYYAVGLMLAGLQFGLVVGFVAGLLSFIPYVGSLVGFAMAIGLALVQFWPDPVAIGTVIAVFALGWFSEGNILSPVLVGRSVGLHPLWLLAALSVFGALFGFVGLLVAVPVAAALGVLARFAAQQYCKSPLYRGLNSGEDD